MATITAALVKELRDKTGAGMMDCKRALTETGGEMEAAIDWLRTKGFAKAAKKAGRVAAEGLVALATKDRAGAMVEVNSETDFVARNEQFQTMASEIAKLALDAGGDRDALAGLKYPGGDLTVEQHVTEMIATIGENMNLRRTVCLTVSPGVVASYVHNAPANAAVSGIGKIGVLVALQSDGDADKLAEFGRQVAMHIAATNPLALSADELDPGVIERERAILVEQARASGKPENIIEKMVEGRLRKYYQDVVLLQQTFVSPGADGDSTVGQALEAAATDVGAPVEIAGFARFALGEGIEKDEDNFAAEVAAAVTGG